MKDTLEALTSRRDYLKRWKYFVEQRDQPTAVQQHEFELLLEQIGWIERVIAIAEREGEQGETRTTDPGAGK